jgi:DNA-binding CsgD family transcriptional regulator
MSWNDEAERYTDQLMEELRYVGAELPPGFRGQFLRHARHLRGDGYGDLGVLLVIECLEAKQKGEALDQVEVRRALDRVRKRLTREASGWRPQPLADSQVPDRGEPPDRRTILLDTLRHAMSGLSVEELLVLELWASGRTSADAAQSLGMSAATFRQRVHRVIARLRAAISG